MLSLSTASPTNVPGQTISSTCCLLTRYPAFSTRTFRTAKAFGRSDIERVPCHKHSLLRSSRNCPNAISFTIPRVKRWVDDCLCLDDPEERRSQNIVLLL